MAKSAAVLGALAVVGGLLWSMSGDSCDDENFEEVPKEKVLEFFLHLQKSVTEKMNPLMQQIAQLQGQPGMNEADLMKIIAQQFDKCCQASQNEILQEMGVEESDLSSTTHKFLQEGDDEVTEAVDSFRSTYALNYGGSVEVEIPKDLSEETMCAAFDSYVVARDEADKTYMKELQKKQGKITPEQHKLLLARANSMMVAALRKHGLTVFQFQTASKDFAVQFPKFKQKHDEDAQQQEEKRQFLTQMASR
jgi:hypothetical protein